MKKIFYKISRILVFAMAVLLFAGGVSFTSYARVPIDTGKKGKLTITYRFKEDGKDSYRYFDGINVSIYKVASVSDDRFSFKLDPPYDSLTGIELDSITDNDTAAAKWEAVQKAVEPEAITNHEPTRTVTTSDGKAVFEGLDLGIYLVKSVVVKDIEEECTYVFSSFLVSVPQLDAETDEWIYDDSFYIAEAFAKCEKTNIEVVKYSLHKRWADSGGEIYRPSTITVKIKRDGIDYNTVTLSDSTGWSYSWKDEPGHLWTFEETYTSDVEYTVSVSDPALSEDGTIVVYTLTNSYSPETPPPPPDNPPPDNPPPDNPPPDNPPPNTPPSNPPGVPDIPAVLGAIRQLPQVLGARRLPQTGQLWWPLPILVIAGIFFIVKGIKKNAKMKAQNN